MREDEYDRMFAVEDAHWWYLSLHELIQKTVSDEYRSKGPLTMLDAGCGTGRMLQLASAYGEAEGIDGSSRAIECCRRRGLKRLAVRDLMTSDLGTDRYDVITSIDVLSHRHIGDEALVLERFAKALRPGGVVILQVPALELLRSVHDEAVFTRRRYLCADMVRLLQEARLTIEQATYRVGLLFPLLAGYRLISRFLLQRGTRGGASSDVWLPIRPINRILLSIMRFENRLLGRLRLPIGTSVYVVARKPIV